MLLFSYNVVRFCHNDAFVKDHVSAPSSSFPGFIWQAPWSTNRTKTETEEIKNRKERRNGNENYSRFICHLLVHLSIQWRGVSPSFGSHWDQGWWGGGGHRFCYTLKIKCEFTRHWSGESAGGRRIVFYFCPPCLILCRHLSLFFLFFFGLCFVWVFYVGGGGG